jgi:hypothetical protein
MRISSLGFVDQIDQCVDAAGEIVGGAYLDIGPGGRLGGKVGGGLQIVIASFRLHLVSHQDVLATLDQVFFPEAEVGVTIRLVHVCLRVNEGEEAVLPGRATSCPSEVIPFALQVQLRQV